MQKQGNVKEKPLEDPEPAYIEIQMPERFNTEYFFWNSPATFEAVAITCCALGVCIGAGITNAINNCHDYPQLWLYISIYSFFHMAEFLVTAHYNTKRVSMASFLLANGWGYAIATTASFSEALLTHYFSPSRHTIGIWTVGGLSLIIVGQYIRTRAMVHAAQSFNHKVQFTKNNDHELVTTDIYSKVRHPSYCGYYLWCVGTQIFLGNPICTFAFSIVLWIFFKGRIAREEHALIRFFGRKYVDYKAAVWSGLPFI